jgi:hypothetical protein
MTVTTLAVETDTALADLYSRAMAHRDRIAMYEEQAKHEAGAKFYYRGRRRVTDMTAAEAEAILADELAKLAAHEAAHAGDGSRWVGYVGIVPPHARRNAERTVAGLAEHRAQLAEVLAETEPLDAVYGEHLWSRFFLVTSSAGHIHSSMHCSTCRPTTTYGWLPELSGATEAEAVEAHGPALCSVCFPTAPIDWVGGKLTKAQAEKAAA